jgi:hypothetical protein
MLASPFLNDEIIPPIKEESIMHAGINCANTTIIPPVRKKHIPSSPIPRTPPIYAIPSEKMDVAIMSEIARITIIFFTRVFTIIAFSPYFHFLTGAGSTPVTIAFSSTVSSSFSFLDFNAKPVAVPIKEKNRIAAGISWRRIMIAPIIRKIHKAIPASLKLIDLANAGDDIRLVIKTAKIRVKLFLPFDISNSPFLFNTHPYN